MYITHFFGLKPILMNEADGGEGGGGGGTALATTTDTSLATTDTGGGTGEGSDGEETALTTTDADGNQPQHVDAGKPSQHPAIEVLKSHADPEVKKFANTVIRDRAFRSELSRMFPGVNPKAAVESLVRDMVSLAGRNYNTPDPRDAAKRTGLQQVRDRLAEIEEIDLMFYDGNPQLLDGMTSDDEGKAAFAKLAPHMLSKWRDIAPKAFSAALARQIVSDMKGAELTNDKGQVVATADIPYRIQRLTMALGNDGVPTELDMKLARNELAHIAAYLYQLNATTALAPEVFTQATDAKDSKLAERERKIAEREAQTRDAEWNRDRQTTANQITTKTWNQLTKGHTISADDQEECLSLFHLRFNNAIKAKEPRADENRKAYIEADDRDGYLAYEKYLMDTYGVPALKEQVKRMMAKMTTKPGQAARTTATATTAAGQTAKPTPGYTKLTAKPPTHVLDYQAMRGVPGLALGKQGVLRIPWEGKPAGTKVAWA